jgi:hypothetical protein
MWIEPEDGVDPARRTCGRLRLRARTRVPGPLRDAYVCPDFRMIRRRQFLAVSSLAALPVTRAQNVVSGTPAGDTGKAEKLPDNIVDSLVAARPSFKAGPAWQRAVDAWLRGHPWRPFQHCLGISGQERYFDHPDEVFYALSLVRPDREETAGAVRGALKPWLESHPPFATEGLPADTGTPREAYEVPAALLDKRPRPARDLFGVYSLWLFKERFGISDDLWQGLRAALEARVRPALAAMKPFDPLSRGKAAIAVRELNGNLAGLIAFLRLCPDSEPAPAVRAQLREALQQRADHEVLNPHVWTPSDLSTKSLHTVMLPRWQRLVPELAGALAAHTGGLAAQRVRIVRESMPAWWIARGDRLSGGENYTSPLHVARALFCAAALIEKLPAATLAAWLDVPWCRGDLAWIERAAWCAA